MRHALPNKVIHLHTDFTSTHRPKAGKFPWATKDLVNVVRGELMTAFAIFEGDRFVVEREWHPFMDCDFVLLPSHRFCSETNILLVVMVLN